MGKGNIKLLTDIAHKDNRLRIIHSSGHVTRKDLFGFINSINPKKVIIIHTNDENKYTEIRNQISIKDGEIVELSQI